MPADSPHKLICLTDPPFLIRWQYFWRLLFHSMDQANNADCHKYEYHLRRGWQKWVPATSQPQPTHPHSLLRLFEFLYFWNWSAIEVTTLFRDQDQPLQTYQPCLN